VSPGARDFLDELQRELAAAGVRGALRARIVAEFADHLRSDPAAQLGVPSELARQFADELGTARIRRGAAATFGGLTLAGLMFIAVFALANLGPLKSAEAHPLARLAAGVLVFAAQIAFATGMLAALRAFWRRRSHALPRAEATVIVRRTSIALGSGLVTMAALAVLALGLGHSESSGWRTFTLVAAAVGAAALLAVSPSVLRAARSLPAGRGERGDIFDDLGPLMPARLRGRPWVVALVVATALFAAVALQGAIASDPFDGLLRGLAEAVACLVGFAALGPYVGLWQPSVA
jgi:hypothetical protein